MCSAGFGRLPKGVSISPGDGYGMLLPLETICLIFSFMPSLTGPYNFQLECQTPLNTNFCLPCTAMARLPAITLSHNHIQVCRQPAWSERIAVSKGCEQFEQGTSVVTYSQAQPCIHSVYLSEWKHVAQPSDPHVMRITDSHLV